MFLDYFKITGIAVAQIFLLAAIGYFLVKKNLLDEAGLRVLSRLVIEVTLPVLIFCQLVKDFKFSLYPNWWIFPLLSVALTIVGLVCGALFLGFIHGNQKKMQFLSLITFQNSGYLPLVLVNALLPQDKSATMFIYIFLFLLGFNLLMWSVGVYMLTFSAMKKFALGSFFSPPVIAVIFSLVFIFFGLERFVPSSLLKPLNMVGDCTLPLALFIVGGSLGQIKLKAVDKKAMVLVVLAKLIILPVIGLLSVLKLKLPQLPGLLIVMQLAMPPATSLALITTHYKKEDLLISQGVFFGHILSILSIPLFLSLYFTLIVIK
ncbi:MAG: AEC family transporter [Candidatus Omnitrophica bacterium]|nr:AEC family transporter [Candidatus Omnitrophota bacterium]